MSSPTSGLENVQPRQPDWDAEIARLQLEANFIETLYALQRHVLPEEAQSMLTDNMPFGYVSSLYPQTAVEIQRGLLRRITRVRDMPAAYVLLDWVTLRWRANDIDVRRLNFWLESIQWGNQKI